MKVGSTATTQIFSYHENPIVVDKDFLTRTDAEQYSTISNSTRRKFIVVGDYSPIVAVY